MQNLLSSQELQRWTSLLKASHVSDAALHQLELPSASAALSRPSLLLRGHPGGMLDAPKRAPLEPPPRPKEGRHVGSAPVRAAVAAAADTDSALAGFVRPPPPAVGEAARFAAVRAWQQLADRNDLPMSTP